MSEQQQQEPNDALLQNGLIMPADSTMECTGDISPTKLSPTAITGALQENTTTIRMLMSGKEVGSIIGRRGENVKRFREKSGARINISDGSFPERIVTTTGSVDQIHEAFTMICDKFESDFKDYIQNANNDEMSCPPVTLRLLVAAIQCGSIIGKGGSKIKELRELTGSSVQVTSEVLPNSSERTVTISGCAKAVSKCIRQVAQILLESPPKGAIILYRSRSMSVNNANANTSALQNLPSATPLNNYLLQTLLQLNSPPTNPMFYSQNWLCNSPSMNSLSSPTGVNQTVSPTSPPTTPQHQSSNNSPLYYLYNPHVLPPPLTMDANTATAGGMANGSLYNTNPMTTNPLLPTSTNQRADPTIYAQHQTPLAPQFGLANSQDATVASFPMLPTTTYNTPPQDLSLLLQVISNTDHVLAAQKNIIPDNNDIVQYLQYQQALATAAVLHQQQQELAAAAAFAYQQQQTQVSMCNNKPFIKDESDNVAMNPSAGMTVKAGRIRDKMT